MFAFVVFGAMALNADAALARQLAARKKRRVFIAMFIKKNTPVVYE